MKEYKPIDNLSLKNLIKVILSYDERVLNTIKDAIGDELIKRYEEDRSQANLNTMKLAGVLMLLTERNTESRRKAMLQALETQTSGYDFSKLIEKIKSGSKIKI